MSTVTVTGLAATTSKSTLEHFFSFCGRIESIEHEGTQAKVVFHKASAAKTALMLNGGTLDGSTISVTSDQVEAPKAASATTPTSTATATSGSGDDIAQEDKPRSAIMAEYLAHGYTLGDHVVERAIQTDKQYGISDRFLSWFNPLASKVQTAASPHLEKAQAKIAQVDEKQGLSLKANAGLQIGSKYYSAALQTPFGSKVHAFYTQAEKQVRDVHEEAMRIRDSKKTSTGAEASATTAPTASTGVADETKSTTQPTQTSSAPIVPGASV